MVVEVQQEQQMIIKISSCTTHIRCRN